jgi:hypothetical protein
MKELYQEQLNQKERHQLKKLRQKQYHLNQWILFMLMKPFHRKMLLSPKTEVLLLRQLIRRQSILHLQ